MNEPAKVEGDGRPGALDPLELLGQFCTPCSYCMDARQRLSQIEAAVKCGEIVADTLREHDSQLHDQQQRKVYRLTHHCPHCGNTGWRLTELGQHLVWLFHQAESHIRIAWRLNESEFPF